MTWEGMDQRRFPRVSYRCLIRVSGNGKQKKIKTFTENIGAGGICVILEKDFGLFNDVSLEVYLGENESPIFCKGTIVWVVKRHPVSCSETAKYDTGIEFKDIVAKDKKRIFQLVQNILEAKP